MMNLRNHSHRGRDLLVKPPLPSAKLLLRRVLSIKLGVQVARMNRQSRVSLNHLVTEPKVNIQLLHAVMLTMQPLMDLPVVLAPREATIGWRDSILEHSRRLLNPSRSPHSQRNRAGLRLPLWALLVLILITHLPHLTLAI